MSSRPTIRRAQAPARSRSRANGSDPMRTPSCSRTASPSSNSRTVASRRFALFLVVILAGAAVCVGALRRLSGLERPAAVALVAAPTAYLAHALVDYNWDFLAVTAPTDGRAGGSRGRRSRDRDAA